VTRNRVLVLAAVLVVFFAIGGYLILRGVGGGGQEVAIHLTISGSTITPANPTAKQGDHVTMTFTADKKEEIHLHGYDIPFQVPGPGGSVTHSFTADKSGSFEMEIEDTGTHLAQFKVNP
jgi:FtsP/CotA-like multicopper oxidase with cupredoxin domain